MLAKLQATIMCSNKSSIKTTEEYTKVQVPVTKGKHFYYWIFKTFNLVAQVSKIADEPPRPSKQPTTSPC